LEAAILGRERVLAAGVKFDRPNDYFAEMLKTDAHMQKVLFSTIFKIFMSNSIIYRGV